jgi:hypothetical protein
MMFSKRPINLSEAFNVLAQLSADFFKNGRKQPKPQIRAAL